MTPVKKALVSTHLHQLHQLQAPEVQLDDPSHFLVSKSCIQWIIQFMGLTMSNGTYLTSYPLTMGYKMILNDINGLIPWIIHIMIPFHPWEMAVYPFDKISDLGPGAQLPSYLRRKHRRIPWDPPIPIGSMVLEYLPTFIPSMTQFCR